MRSDDVDDLISNFSRFYILTILYEGPTHGYDISRKFKKRVGKTLSPGLIYPFLQTMEKRGLLTHTIEPVGEKERKMYKITEEGLTLCNKLFKRFASLVKTAIEPSLYTCAHCGCKVYEGGYTEVLEGVKTTFCCIHCAQSYKQEHGLLLDKPTSLRDGVSGEG